MCGVRRGTIERIVKCCEESQKERKEDRELREIILAQVPA
jgi:hypothetical protein